MAVAKDAEMGIFVEEVYEPGIAGARQWFFDHTAKFIAERMEHGQIGGVQKPTLVQQRLLTLIGLEIPINRHMAEVMLLIAGFHRDGLPKKMTRLQAKKLSDAELMERAKR